MQKQASLLASRYNYIPMRNGTFWNRSVSILPSEEIEFLHYHDCVEIGYCESGQGLIVIGEKFETVQCGDASFVAPGVRHYSRSLDSCRCQFIFIDPIKLPVTMVNLDEVGRRLAAAQSSVLRGEVAEHTRRTAWEFMRGVNDAAALERAAVMLAHLALMLPASTQADVDSASRDSVAAEGVARDSIAYDAAAYMKLHYTEPLKISELAGLCHLSESRLRRRFAAEYGCAPHEYLARIRADVGAELLRRTQMTISEIASAVGFGCDSEFYRCFTGVYGMAPSAWRRQQTDAVNKNLKKD